MGRFLIKIAFFAIVIVGLVLLVKNMSSGIKEATDFEKSEQLAQKQEARLQAELAEAERKAKEQPVEPEPVAETKRVEQIAVEVETKPKPKPPEMPLEDRVRAQQLYQWAETEYKIARKPMMSYARMVKFCRQIISEYPHSPEAAKAKVLLGRVPERFRRQYKITDEEIE